MYRLRGRGDKPPGQRPVPRAGSGTARPGDQPSRIEILRAVPAGSVRIRGQTIERQYLDTLGADPRYLQLKPIAQINTMRVAKYLARRASYTDATTRRGTEAWWQLARFSLTTWKVVRRRLEAWGYLGCVVEGTTPEFSPMALIRGARNRAAVYVLCVPRKTRSRPESAQLSPATRPPTQSARTGVKRPARESGKEPGENPEGRPCGPAQPLRPVANLLRKATGQTITYGWAAWIWGPFAAAGWTLGDLQWAIDHAPDGAQHRYSARIRHGVGWLRHRLGLWLDVDGRPRASIREQRRRARERFRAEAERHRAAMADLSRIWTDPAPHAAEIRARMHWRNRDNERG